MEKSKIGISGKGLKNNKNLDFAIFNPLHNMPVLGFSQFNSQKRYDVKNMDKWGYSYLLELETLWEKEKLLITSSFSFSQNVFKSCLFLMHQKEYLWSKGLKNFSGYKIKVTQKSKLGPRRVENIVRSKNYQLFLFLQFNVFLWLLHLDH